MKSEFKAIPLKHRPDRDTWHELFIKEFQQKKHHPDLPIGKTLLILNCPPYLNEYHLEFGFNKIGTIERIIFVRNVTKDEIPPMNSSEQSKYFPVELTGFTFRCAYVIFSNSKSLRKALEMTEISLYEDNGERILVTGIDKWMQEFLSMQTNEDELVNEIEGYLNVFDAKEEEIQKEETSASGTVDDEGWQTVGTKGRIPKFAPSEQILQKLQNKIDFGTKKKELTNFYRFQKNDGHKSRKRMLKTAFAADREKLDDMKKIKRLREMEGGSLGLHD